MKLVQANIWGGRLEPQILRFMEAQKPDIICLQEAIEIDGGKGALFASIDEIKTTANTPHVFMSPVFTLNYMNRKASFGNAVLSKYPFTTKKTIFTGKEYVDNFDFLDRDADMRNLQLARVILPDGEPLHILNHHGHHIHQHKNGDEETMRQCKIIADEIKRLNGKIIVTGDFNLAPHSESINQISVLLRNLSIDYKLKTTRTALTHKTEVCDYIFVSEPINVSSFEASGEIISDHQALVLEFS